MSAYFRNAFSNVLTTTRQKLGINKTKIDELVDILNEIYGRYNRIKKTLLSSSIHVSIITKNDIINLITNNLFNEIFDNFPECTLSTYYINYNGYNFDQQDIGKYFKDTYSEDFKNKIKKNNVYTFILYLLLDLTCIYKTFFSKNETYTVKNGLNTMTINFEKFIINYNHNYHLYSMLLLYEHNSDSELIKKNIPVKRNILNNIESNNREINDYITNIKSHQLETQKKEEAEVLIDSLKKFEDKKQELNNRFTEITDIPNISIYNGLIETIITKYNTILQKSSGNNDIKYDSLININNKPYNINLSKNDIDQLKILDDDYKKLLVEERKAVTIGIAGGSNNLRHSIDLIIQLFKKQRPSLNINPDLLYNCILSSSNKNNKKPLRKYNNQRTKI